MQTLVESQATQHNILAVRLSAEKLMRTPVQKLGVVLELLSAKGSQAVDPSCRQLRDNSEQDTGDTRWAKPPNAEWETLNVTRINLSYSCETLLLCLIRGDVICFEPEDHSLRIRLRTGAKIIKDILYQIHWTYPSIKFADIQIRSFEEVEAENKDIFLKASRSTFDHTELSISVSLFKGMLHFLHAYKGGTPEGRAGRECQTFECILVHSAAWADKWNSIS